MAEWTDVCGTDNIEMEDMKRVDHSGRSFIVYRSPDDEFFCTEGHCTHERVHLADGLVIDYEIECPKHQATFDYRTGEVLRAPACLNLRTFKTKVENGRVFIEI